MDAAVLSLAAMPEAVDCNSNSLDAELEVKKLQELVRKLERQNERLRTRAHPPSPPPPYALLLLGRTAPGYLEPSAGEDGAEEGEEEEDERALLDELEPLDLDSMCASSSDESPETWLYITQRSTGSSDGSLTPLQWCRHVLDSPKSELEVTRRSLSLRLEQVSRWRSSLSSPSHTSSLSSSLSGVSPFSASPSAKPCSTPRSERHAPLSSPLHPVLQRSLSPVPPVAERTPTFLPHLFKRSRSLQRSLCSPHPPVDEGDSVCGGFKLQDLTDVQVMARMQEDSLRQELAFPPRRSHSLGSFPPSAGAPPGRREEEEEDDEEDDEDYALLPPPAPRLARLPRSSTFHALSRWAGGTPSPRRPSAGSAFLSPELERAPGPRVGPGTRPGSDNLRRSMPDLVRAPSVPLPPSPGASPRLLRSSHSFDFPSVHCSTPPPFQSWGQSVGGFCVPHPTSAKATAYVSPTVKSSAYLSPTGPALSSPTGIPLLGKHAGFPPPPRSALPRPASFSTSSSSAPHGKLAQSGRSFLTPPRSLSTLSALRDAWSDAAWRDGCY